MCEALKNLMKDEIAEMLAQKKIQAVMEVQKKNALKFYKQEQQTPDFIADFLEVPIEQVKQWLGLATD